MVAPQVASEPRWRPMLYEVMMRDGSTREVDALYIDVTSGRVGTFTLLRPASGYPIAIVAAFPIDQVQWVGASQLIDERGSPEGRQSRDSSAHDE
jgi:hypothetical protein